MESWQTKSSRIAYENPFMRVYEDQAITPTGKDTIYGYIESTENSAYIVPIDSNGMIHLVSQYRYPMKETYWEIPAGRIPKDEDIIDGAKRELTEETGLSAGSMIRLGQLVSAPGITTFISELFLAEDITTTSDQLDRDDGIIATKPVSIDEVYAMIERGEIQCAMSVAAISLAINRYRKASV